MQTGFESAVTVRWIKCNNIRVLNVAGPRLSKAPSIYAYVWTILSEVLKRTNQIEDIGPVPGEFVPGALEDDIEAKCEFFHDGEWYSYAANRHKDTWIVVKQIGGKWVGQYEYVTETGQEAPLQALATVGYE